MPCSSMRQHVYTHGGGGGAAGPGRVELQLSCPCKQYWLLLHKGVKGHNTLV